MFPKPKFINLPDLKLAIYESGTASAANKPPIILCHGFPEIAFSWRHQLPALNKAGFRAIAPDMRGYGETGRPLSDKRNEAGVALYSLKHLMGDMIALLDALEIDKAIFCGHDWGGFVVWQLPLYYPNRVAGVIGVNTPFSARSEREPIGALRHIFGEDNYMVRFQEFDVVEKLFDADIDRSMRFWYRKGMTRKQYDAQPKERRGHSFVKSFQAGGEMGGELIFTPEELEVYKNAFSKTGYAPGMGWYRNMSRNWEESEGVKDFIPHPSLMISAADDVVLPPEAANGMENYIPDLEKHIIPDCGHWTQAEQPEALNRLITDWLSRRFK